jgi:hypothetical protein
MAIGDDDHLPSPIISNIHLDRPMELDRVLPGVAPDCSRVPMSSVLSQIIKTDTIFS